MPNTAYVAEGIRAYEQVLERDGPAGLDFLNARVPHRFTGVYRLEDGVMHNVYLHDKQGEIIPEYLQAVPLGDSFCQFVLRDREFRTCDTAREPMLNGHKYQGVIGAYYGVPLVNNYGDLYGTLCHFDVLNYSISDDEFAFFSKAALLLPKYLLRKKSQIKPLLV